MHKIKVVLIFMGIATNKGILDPQMMMKIMTMMMTMTRMMMMMDMKMINHNLL